MAQNEDPESAEMMMKRCLLAKSKRAIIVTSPHGSTEYCCVECPFKTSEKNEMELHLSVHNREYRFLCGICGTALKRKEHLDRHTMEHQEYRPHVCPDCGKAFKRKEHLNIHRTIHSGQKNYTCPLCERSFYRKDHLQKHLQTHSKVLMGQNVFPTGDEVQVKTEVLDIKLEAPDEGAAEGGLDHSMMECDAAPLGPPADPERPHACPHCDKTYKRKDHLKLHSVSHMARDKLCLECGKAFRTEAQLRGHASAHAAPEGPAPAAEGDPEFSPGPLLMRAAERPHACPVCRRRFKRKQHLLVHAAVHASRPAPAVWCSACSEGFFENSQFEGHQCAGAPPSPANRENEAVEILNEPIALEPPPLPVPQRVFVCRFCAKPFKRKDHYRIHLHVHTGLKSFFCPDCGKGFYRKDHLQKHSQVHVKHKPKMAEMMRKVKKELPELFPIHMLPKHTVQPEITITAPANSKLRVPLQMKVPYQVVVATAGGERRAVTVLPRDLLA